MATRERILDAAELLFSEFGYSGTSVRAITEHAGVNLAAANYHFGSKEMLLEATFQRRLTPINQARIARLDALEAQAPGPTVDAIVRAFVEPILPAGADPKLSHLLAKIFAEPKHISVPLLERTFGPVALRFFSALKRKLPDVKEQDLRWRFHLLIGAMVHLANFHEPLNLFGRSPNGDPANSSAGLEHLIRFAVAGLCQDNIEVGTRP
jgi:AcrR family transcriptional regulator